MSYVHFEGTKLFRLNLENLHELTDKEQVAANLFGVVGLNSGLKLVEVERALEHYKRLGNTEMARWEAAT